MIKSKFLTNSLKVENKVKLWWSLIKGENLWVSYLKNSFHKFVFQE